MSRLSWMYRGLVVAGLVLGLALPAQAITIADSRLGGLAFYDSDLDITWAAGLTIGSVSGWRLPTTMQPDATCSDHNILGTGADGGFNCTGSEMGHLFASLALGGEGITATSLGPFSNVQTPFYWSGTEFAPLAGNAWHFGFDSGNQRASNLNGSLFAWAVRSGRG